MTTQFLIIEDGKIVDGEFKSREDVIGTLPHCAVGSTIWWVHIANGDGSMIDETADLIHSAHFAQAWTRAEIEGSPLLSSYIELPVSREEQRADDADARRFEE